MPDQISSDLRSAARMLASRPGFAAVAILTLALGIGANTAIFSVVHAVLLRPLPYRDADRLVRAVNVVREANFELTSGADFLDWRDQSRLLDGVAAFDSTGVTLQGDERPERIQAARVSATFLPTLGVPLAQGRGFEAREERLNGGPAAIATDRFWTRRFGRSARLGGQTIRLDDRIVPLVGVLPAGFQVPSEPDAEILVPLTLDETVERGRQQMTILTVIGRLKPGVTVPQARAELAGIRQRAEAAALAAAAQEPAAREPAASARPEGLPGPAGPSAMPGGNRVVRRMVAPPGAGGPMRRVVPPGAGNAPPLAAGPEAGAGVPSPGGSAGPAPQGSSRMIRIAVGAGPGPGGPGAGGRRGAPGLPETVLQVTPVREWLVGDVRLELLLLLGAVGCVLLIACANVANLLLARATARRQEIAIRAALGADRGRLARLLLTESAALGLLGGACGLLLAAVAMRPLVSRIPPELGSGVFRHAEIGLDGPVLLFTLGLALATGLLFGLAPALAASRPDLQEPLKEGRRGTRRSGAARGLLVAAEVAVAALLLVGAGLLLRSFLGVKAIDLGFEPARVATVRLNLDPQRYTAPAAQVSFFQELARRARALPGVAAVTFADSLPLQGFSRIVRGMNAEGRPPFEPGEAPEIGMVMVGPEYFRTMGIRLLRGRAFEASDAADGQPVAIVSEGLARRLWGEEDPVGRRLTGGPLGGFLVVGLVADVKHEGIEDTGSRRLQMYRPYLQQPLPSGSLAVRTQGDPAKLVPALRREIQAFDPALPALEFTTLDDQIADTLAGRRFNLTLLALFALLALVLAAIGLYGVLSYMVTERTHEIGIRLALGAERERVRRLVLRQGLAMALAGVAAGLLLALAAGRLLTSSLYGITAADPLTFAAIPLLLLAVAAFAAWLPAWRATRVDPMIALRGEA